MDTYTTCSPSLLRANEKMSWNFSFKNNFHHSNVFFFLFYKTSTPVLKYASSPSKTFCFTLSTSSPLPVSLRLPPNYSLLPVSFCLTTSHPLLFQNIHHCFPLFITFHCPLSTTLFSTTTNAFTLPAPNTTSLPQSLH